MTRPAENNVRISARVSAVDRDTVTAFCIAHGYVYGSDKPAWGDLISTLASVIRSDPEGLRSLLDK